MRQNRGTAGKSVLVALLFLVLASGCSAADTSLEDMDAASGQDKIAGTELGEDGALTVTFLDVGQGNAVLVEQDGEYMLIDGGDREYSSFVVSYLKEQGVDEFAYDHLNGIVGALNVFPCKLVLAPDYTADSRVYTSFLDVIEERDIELVYPAVGDTYTLGGAEFTVVCPDSYDALDANDNSVGVRLTYGETSFLICGDAGTGVEREMIERGIALDSDVYLASHHGSSGSSSLEFLQAVGPEAVVISAGRDNPYGHPTTEVLENIQSVEAALYRTDLQGTLTAVSDGSAVTWNVAACTDYRDGEILEAAGVPEETAAGADAEVAGVSEESEPSDPAAGTVNGQAEYVMNRNTKKFHLPSCASVSDISPENKAYFTGSREELIAAGYEPCKRCDP